jgi:neurotransmitter:Na+ symporter, NSS family
VTTAGRETFSSRFAAIVTMVGVAMGLGNVWRFPYMVGKFGGAAFVLFYTLISLFIGVPALMAEWTLGRHTRRGTVGAFELGGFPGGKFVGWFFFAIVVAATAYYTNVIGWVLYYAAGEIASAVGLPWTSSRVLPPNEGFVAGSMVRQLACTALVILSCVFVLLKGLRNGIEVVTKAVMPALLIITLILIWRAVTLPGASAGIAWYLLKFRMSDITAGVMVAALGQVMFSLSLGGTFMVVYGSYLSAEDDLRSGAIWTTIGDTGTGLLAGFAIFPAVFALGLEPNSGPGLIFETLPNVFARIPLGWMFGLLFFISLLGAGYLSDVAAFEVLIRGLTDSTPLTRARATWIVAGAVFVMSIPPMISMKVFLPWDLTFGSGMQTLGALLAVITVGWCMKRSDALRELAAPVWLYYWIRFVIPGAIIVVGIWWILSDVLGVTTSV